MKKILSILLSVLVLSASMFASPSIIMGIEETEKDNDYIRNFEVQDPRSQEAEALTFHCFTNDITKEKAVSSLVEEYENNINTCLDAKPTFKIIKINTNRVSDYFFNELNVIYFWEWNEYKYTYTYYLKLDSDYALALTTYTYFYH